MCMHRVMQHVLFFLIPNKFHFWIWVIPNTLIHISMQFSLISTAGFFIVLLLFFLHINVFFTALLKKSFRITFTIGNALPYNNWELSSQLMSMQRELYIHAWRLAPILFHVDRIMANIAVYCTIFSMTFHPPSQTAAFFWSFLHCYLLEFCTCLMSKTLLHDLRL